MFLEHSEVCLEGQAAAGPPVALFHRPLQSLRHHFGLNDALARPPDVLETDAPVLIHREVHRVHVVVVLPDGCIETVEIDKYRRIAALTIAQALTQESQQRFLFIASMLLSK